MGALIGIVLVLFLAPSVIKIDAVDVGIKIANAQSSGSAADPYTAKIPPGGDAKINALNCLTSPVDCVLTYMAYTASIVGSLVISIFALLAQASFQLNTVIMLNPVVTEGFKIALAFANLGFVLGIIIIAISTILRIESYGMKKLLIKLVAMAILINFSLVIASAALSFSNNLTGFFLEKTNPATSDQGFYGFATNMISAFGPQKLYNVSSGVTDSLAKGFSEVVIGALNMYFVGFFSALLAFLFLAMAALMGVRFVYITMLLVVMPFAWMMWVFPSTQHLFKQWSDKFVKWVMFQPIMFFFVYLSLLVTKNVGDFKLVDQASPILTGLSNSGMSIFVAQASTFANMLVVIALALGGLFVANKMGIEFASNFYNGGKKMTQNMGKWMWNSAGGTRNVARHLATPRASAAPSGRFAGLRSLANKWTGGGLLAPRPTRSAALDRATALRDGLKKEIESKTTPLRGIKEELTGAELNKNSELSEKLRKDLAERNADIKLKKGSLKNAESDVERLTRNRPVADRAINAFNFASAGLAGYGARMQTSPGLVKSLWSGARDGSGFFKKQDDLTKAEKDKLLKKLGIDISAKSATSGGTADQEKEKKS